MTPEWIQTKVTRGRTVLLGRPEIFTALALGQHCKNNLSILILLYRCSLLNYTEASCDWSLVNDMSDVCLAQTGQRKQTLIQVKIN